MRARPNEALVGFRCARREHARPSVPYTLTIHDGKWAFCHHQGATTDHEWVPTGGVRLQDMLRARSSEERIVGPR